MTAKDMKAGIDATREASALDGITEAQWSLAAAQAKQNKATHEVRELVIAIYRKRVDEAPQVEVAAELLHLGGPGANRG
jgi:hypothetical protein